jgi:hypothetical protein
MRTSGVGPKRRLFRLPIADRDTVTYLYSLLDVPRKSVRILDWSLPLADVRCRGWIDGCPVEDGTVLVLEPGLHRVMLRVKGRLVSPFLMARDAGRQGGNALRHEILLDEWKREEQHHVETGDRPSMWRYLRKAGRAVRITLHAAEEDVRASGRFDRVDAMAMAAYQKSVGEPLARDVPLPFSAELTPRVWPRITAEQLCFAMHLADPEIKPALAWEFQRRYMPGGLGQLPCHFLAAAFVNYPMDVEPRRPPFAAGPANP